MAAFVSAWAAHEREAGAKLAVVLDLIWAARSPAAGDYEEAAMHGKAMIARVRQSLLSSPVKE